MLLALLIGAMALTESVGAAPSLTSSPSGALTLWVDATQQITLSLDAQPSGDVTVILVVTDPSVAGLSSGSGEPASRLALTFPAATWQTSQRYTIIGLGPGMTTVARQVSGGGGDPAYRLQRVEVSSQNAQRQGTAMDDCSADTTTACSITAPSGSTTVTTASGEIESLVGVDWTTTSHGDIDWFKVNFVKGGKYWIQILGSTDSDSNTLRWPAILAVYDSSGVAVPGMLRTTIQTRNPIQMEAPQAGLYHIAVSHYHYNPTNQHTNINDRVGTYTLRIALSPATDDCVENVTTTCEAALATPLTGDIQWKRIGEWWKYGDGYFPQDVDWIQVDLTEGKIYRFDLEGKVGDDTTKGTLSNPDLADRYYTISNANTTEEVFGRFVSHDVNQTRNDTALFKAPSTGTYYFVVSHQSGSNVMRLAEEFRNDTLTGTYTFTVTEVLDHTDDCSEATDSTCAVSVGGEGATGTIELRGDQDWYSVQLETGKNYLITQAHRWSGNRLSLSHSKIFGIYNAAAESQIEGFYYPYGRSWLTYTPTVAGTYFIGAGADWTIGGTGTYVVAVRALPVDDIASDATTTSHLTIGGSATGTIGTTQDVDWHRATLSASTTYVFEVEPHYGGNNTVCEDGDMAERLRNFYGEQHCLYGWRGTANIALDALYDASGSAALTAEDAPHGPYRIVYTPTSGGTFYIATTGAGVNVGPYTVTLKTAANASMDDHPADQTTLGVVSPTNPLQGRIDYIQDVDWVKATLRKGVGYVFEAHGRSDAQGHRRHQIWDEPKVFTGDGSRLPQGRVDGVRCVVPEEDGAYYVQIEARYFYVGPYELTMRIRPGGCE